MSLLLYGIAEARGRAGNCAAAVGLGGRPLRRLDEGPLTAVVSDHPGPNRARAVPATAAASEYDRTIRRLMEHEAILPARFGSLLDDELALRALLRSRREELLSRLGCVRGAVEIGLRAAWRPGADGTPGSVSRPASVSGPDSVAGSGSGSAYLRERVEARRRARRVADDLDPLTAVARSARRALVPAPGTAVLDAYLVDRERLDEFVALVERLDSRLDGVDVVCTGPWPPYSFAEGAPV